MKKKPSVFSVKVPYKKVANTKPTH